MIDRILRKGSRPHVCIVGAGVAGLRCADVLLQHDVKVTIFEARNRVGGRLYQGKVGKHLVDLGPNWIHGTHHNPILDLVKETDTSTHSWDYAEAVFNRMGSLIPDKRATELNEVLWEIIGEAFKYSNKNSISIPVGQSLKEFIEEKLLERYPDSDTRIDNAAETRAILMDMAKWWGSFVGSPFEKQSLKFFWLEETIDGENLFIPGTYEKVLTKIAKPAIEKALLKFDSKVSKITSNNGENDTCIKVKTVNGQIKEFDEVVVTTPLGYLQKNKTLFDPPLPKDLQESIDAPHYGALDKVYVTFKSAFWNTAGLYSHTNGSELTSTLVQHAVPNLTATTTQIHTVPEKLKENSAESWPGFTHWLTPEYALPTNPHHWNQESVNMASFTNGLGHPTLLFYIHEPCSRWLAEKLKSDPAGQQKFLESFFKPYYSLLPGYDESSTDCQPLDFLATQWATDELAGEGSYMNFQIGVEAADKDIERMRYGMPERGIWLAGEHTSPFVAVGTLTGAYWSGEGVAKRILSAYGITSDEDSESSMENTPKL
ncbi:FAD/NAD(P)-binding domain-containing protein [Patellaria atrata CBS 101060]|uniref:FAD/NAD(P)-binding domain-containing protein n=1 Tax=Patellaria atrata CBS 101060 TaxID=1346257 RepID=A0A9P4S985_9PEZI|nr:FAD/NAD(P)-binding domain-containing protein [Patellaria atrata CBS 101060]